MPVRELIAHLKRNPYVFGAVVRVFFIAVAMIQVILMARYLGPELRGVLTYDLSLIALGSVVLSFGLFDAYPFFRRKYSDVTFDGDRYISVFMSLVVAQFLVVAVIVAAWAGAVLLLWPEHSKLILFLLAIPLWTFSLIVSYVALMESPNRRNAVFSSVAALDALNALMLLLVAPRMYLFAIGAAALIEILKIVLFLKLCHFRLSFKHVTWARYRELLMFGALPMIALLLTTLNYRVDVIVLSHVGSVSAAAIGVYVVGMGLAEKTTSLADAVREVLLSRLSSGKGGEEVAHVIRLCMYLTLAVGACIVALGYPFISLMYGPEFRGAYGIAVVTVLGVIWMVYFKLIAQYNLIMKKQHVTAILLAGTVALNVTLNLVLIPVWGIFGAAWATVFAYFACAVGFIVYFVRSTGIPARDLVQPSTAELAFVKSIWLRKGLTKRTDHVASANRLSENEEEVL